MKIIVVSESSQLTMCLENDDDPDEDLSSEDEDNGKVVAEFCQASSDRSSGALGEWEIHTKVCDLF